MQLDTAHGSIFIDTAPQLEKYRTLFEKIKSAALSAAKSRDIIHRTAQDM